MAWFVTLIAGVFGLLIGSFLNVVIWRVPRDESVLPASHCPSCEAKIRPWQNVPVVSWLALRGRCASCRARISARYPLVELGTGLLFAGVGWWSQFLPVEYGTVAWVPALLAYLWLAGAAVALTFIDIDHQRLPNVIVLPSILIVAGLLSASAIVAGDWGQLWVTLGGAGAMFAFYAVIVLVYPQGMGLGDVKLAPVLGAALGFLGWPAVAVGAFAGFLFGALWGVGAMAFKRAGRKTAIPFGPFMLLGTAVSLVAWEPVWTGYLRLTGLA